VNFSSLEEGVAITDLGDNTKKKQGLLTGPGLQGQSQRGTEKSANISVLGLGANFPLVPKLAFIFRRQDLISHSFSWNSEQQAVYSTAGWRWSCPQRCFCIYLLNCRIVTSVQ